MEDKSGDKVAIDIENASGVILKNVRTIGYNKGIRAKNITDLSTENFESSNHLIDTTAKWYKDIRFLLPIIVTIIITVVTWIYFS